MSIDAFVTWLADSPMSAAIGNHQWVTPAVQTVHILAIAVVMSAILMTDLRVLGAVGKGETMQRFAKRYVPWMAMALLILLLSGSVLIIGEPKRSLENPIFILKMGLLAAALVITATINGPVFKSEEFWQPTGRKVAVRTLAVVSLGVWSCIVFAGRWIAYAIT
jgi:hypothetical protein